MNLIVLIKLPLLPEWVIKIRAISKLGYTRLRNSLQQIKKLAQEIRQEVSELKVSSKK